MKASKKLVRALDNVAAAVRGDHLPDNTAARRIQEHADVTSGFELGYRRAEHDHRIPNPTPIDVIRDLADNVFDERLGMMATHSEKAKSK